MMVIIFVGVRGGLRGRDGQLVLGDAGPGAGGQFGQRVCRQTQGNSSNE